MMNKEEAQQQNHAIDFITIGKRIRACRKDKRMTQENLGKATGVTTSFISHVERGSRIPSVDTLFKIAKVLSVSVDMLLIGISSMMESSANIPKQMRILNNMIWVLNKHADEWLQDE